jgi:zinc protease
MRAALCTVIMAAALRAQGPPIPPVSMPPSAPPRAGSAAVGAGRGAVPSYKNLTYPALRPFQPPRIETFQLANGMKLYLSEDHDLPLISGTAMVRTGGVFDPPGEAGLAQLTGLAMRSGGTRLRTGEQLDAALENLASRVDVNIGDTLGTVSFSCLKEQQGETLAIFKDILTGPVFRPEKVEVSKTQLRAAIARRNDDPRQILQRESAAVLYGKDTPYAARQEFATVDSILRSDVEAFYRRYFFPGNVMLELHGDFDAAQMKAQLEKIFGDWTVSQPPVPEFPEVAPSSGGAYLAAKRDLTRVWFSLSALGTEAKDKDAPVMEIIAAILGGSPNARLAKRKVAITAGQVDMAAAWFGNLDRPGLLDIGGAVPASVALQTVQTIREDIQQLRSTEVTGEELKAARDVVLARLAFVLDTPARMLSRMLLAEYYGYPRDLPVQRQKDLAAVTRADVLRVAKERLDAARLTLFLLGDADFAKQMEALGTSPQIVDISIPPARPGAAPSDTASLEHGKQLLRKARQASGGEENWTALKDMTQVVTYVLSAMAGGGARTQTTRWIAPAVMRQENTLPTGRVIAFLDGSSGWISNGRDSGALVGPQLQQMQRDLFMLYPRLIQSDRIEGRMVNALDDQTVEIQEGSAIVRLILDPQTGLPVKILHEAPGSNGLPVAIEEDLKEFREVGGLKVPHQIDILQNGQKFAEATVTDLQFNQGVKAEELQRRP